MTKYHQGDYQELTCENQKASVLVCINVHVVDSGNFFATLIVIIDSLWCFFEEDTFQ